MDTIISNYEKLLDLLIQNSKTGWIRSKRLAEKIIYNIKITKKSSI